jgi:hypothetical protein
MCLPKGQEAELAGFFVYCTQILGWLPPLLFTLLVQNDISQKYGVVVSSFGFAVAIIFLSCTGTWSEIVEEAQRNQSVNLAVGPGESFKEEDNGKVSGAEEAEEIADAEAVA